VGAVMAREILRRLKFDRAFIDHVTRLVRMHMRANAYNAEWTDGAVRRLMYDAGDALQDLLDLSRADITSYRPERVSRAVARVDDLERRARWLREEAERVPIRSPLDGNDLMKLFDREPGAWIRPIKDHLLNLVIDGALAPDDREAAADEARRMMAVIEGNEDGEQSAQSAQSAVPDAAPLEASPSPTDNITTPKHATRAAARRRSRTETQPER
jgi:poly(A) polymerase